MGECDGKVAQISTDNDERVNVTGSWHRYQPEDDGRVNVTGRWHMCVCVWPPVKDELLLSMRFQFLVLTSMTSPPYPRPQ